MIDTTIKMTVSREKRKEVLQTLTAIPEPIRCEKGCLSYNPYVDVESETMILFKEEWQTREDLEPHLRSLLFGVLIGAMKLLDKEPDVTFKTIASVGGWEREKEVRVE